jgi:hypothetical protein
METALQDKHGNLTIYGTDCCHLCESAAGVLAAAGFVATKIDIAGSDELMAKYGAIIPVLARADSDAELCWPFDVAMVRRFVALAE